MARTATVHDGVAILTRDGVELVADIVLPSGDGPFPCLLQRVPYNRQLPGIRDGVLDVFRAARRGYAVITQDCRGRYGSTGVFEPFLHEGHDGADTIEWIAAQPWSSGSVGMFGRSYSGVLQWSAAAQHPPALKAIAPAFSGSDPVDDWFGGNRAFEWGFALLWFGRYLAPDVLVHKKDQAGLARLLELVPAIPSILTGPLHDDRLAQLVDLVPGLASLLDRRAESLQQWHGPESSDVPALVIAGWYDIFLDGCLRAWAANESVGELIVGPWAHGGANSGVFADLDLGPGASADAVRLTDRQLDWFDRWLLDPPAAQSAPTRSATWFHQVANVWRTEAAWPPPECKTQQLFIAPEGLSPNQPNGGGCVLAYSESDPVPTVGGRTFLPGMEVAANAGPADQSKLLGRLGVLTFAGEELARDLDAIGPVTAQVIVAGAPTGIRVVARLLDIDSTGRATLVCDGAAHADAQTPTGDAQEGTDVQHARVSLGATSYRFLMGHRIGVMLSHTSTPRYERWVLATGPDPAGPRSGVTTICFGPSVLTLTTAPTTAPTVALTTGAHQ